MNILRLCTFLFLGMLITSFGLKQNFRSSLIWEDEFTQEETDKITTWITDIGQSVAQNFGSYPFNVNFYIHRSNQNEPVPWAHTSRTQEEAIHFYVNPDFSLEQFQKDWTAPHEIAHLSIPYLGKENTWFAEGYATFWQWKILNIQGIFTSVEVIKMEKSRMKNALEDYKSNEPFLAENQQLLREHNYPAVYWGGACYFYKVDQDLKNNHHLSLQKVMQQYQKDARLKDQNFDDLIHSLDRISRTKVFSQWLQKFKTKPAKVLLTEIAS